MSHGRTCTHGPRPGERPCREVTARIALPPPVLGVVLLPLTAEAGLAVLPMFVVGVIAIVVLARMALADHVQRLFVDGPPDTGGGGFHSTDALFTIAALVAITLAGRRELPGLGWRRPDRDCRPPARRQHPEPVLVVQLPLVVVVAIAIVPERPRFIVAAAIQTAETLAILRSLLGLYHSSAGAALDRAAAQAGEVALVVCGGMFVAGTLSAWGEMLSIPRLRSVQHGGAPS